MAAWNKHVMQLLNGYIQSVNQQDVWNYML